MGSFRGSCSAGDCRSPPASLPTPAAPSPRTPCSAPRGPPLSPAALLRLAAVPTRAELSPHRRQVEQASASWHLPERCVSHSVQTRSFSALYREQVFSSLSRLAGVSCFPERFPVIISSSSASPRVLEPHRLFFKTAGPGRDGAATGTRRPRSGVHAESCCVYPSGKGAPPRAPEG